ncbi:hypothetical protein HK407_08g12650 [Ordospora pajunii]|jgi:hypothetical protein|uniref:uncharacterized protein n=1 Tax=Ordospora pajunii TaxID=3039483 RepID=UPI0029528082|nr:uncharacterized protein HK407_08g12650 [Ordospora pajunii]KAH9411121.1 hypothetical protein HK407_08g12650 [Ordospora pajunii]
MDANKLLQSDKCKAMLVEALKSHIKRHGFDKQIDDFLNNVVYSKMHDAVDSNEAFTMLYNFVIANLPPEVQYEFYCDVRNFISENVTIDE